MMRAGKSEMRKISKWTDDKLREIYDWRMKNEPSLAEMAEHFGETKSAIAQAYCKAKKKFGGKIMPKSKRSNLPAVVKPKRARMMDLEVPDEPQREPMVAVAIMPMANLADLVRGLYGSR
jgi:hypothetical protein